MSDSKLDIFRQRDATAFGRFINHLGEFGRAVTGQPLLWTQAASLDARESRERMAQAFDTKSMEAVNQADLSATDKYLALTMISDLSGPPRNDTAIEMTIQYVKERADERVNTNQLRLFDEPVAERNYTHELPPMEQAIDRSTWIDPTVEDFIREPALTETDMARETMPLEEWADASDEREEQIHALAETERRWSSPGRDSEIDPKLEEFLEAGFEDDENPYEIESGGFDKDGNYHSDRDSGIDR